MCRRKAFTLVELMIVIGVILLLLSILFPAISTAREQSRAVRCQNNQRCLWAGFVSFAADHEGRIPGSSNDGGNPEPQKRDWMQGSQVGNYLAAPQQGTLFRP